MVDASRTIAVLTLVLAAACSRSEFPEATIAFEPPKAHTPSQANGERPKLRFSVATMLSPRDTYSGYSTVIERLGAQLGMDVEFVQRRTYGEVNELLLSGALDAAFVCTGGWFDLAARAPGATELIAVPVVDGGTTYHSLILVPETSTAATLSDLRGKRFAFTDELSLSGHEYPNRLLRERSTSPSAFFAATLFTRSHDRSVEAVAKGLVDGAAVDSLVYDQMVARDPALAERVRVIHRSPAFGIAPIVASTRLPTERRAALRQAFLELAQDPQAAKALRVLHIERFAAPDPSMYSEPDAARGAP